MWSGIKKTMGNNQTSEKIKIEIKDVMPDFKEHLSLKGNDRVFFSGKFGIGKSYFLKEFFRLGEENYEVFYLLPTRYQISPNEDILDFIKYDVLVDLINKNKEIFKGNNFNSFIDLKRLFYIWGKDNFYEIFKKGLDFIPKLGKPLKEVVNLIDNFRNFKYEVELGDKGFVDNYIKEIKSKDIVESDHLSYLLTEKINNLKGEKESVLIIDDLDRIDPDNIFRILNIFSVYFNEDNSEMPNKFGFDRIIFVGDHKNIRSIFNHKYGENTDFRGYFNKFFRYKIYEFDNDKAIENAVSILIDSMKEVGINVSKIFEKLGYGRLLLEDVLKRSINLKSNKEKVNLRQLLNVYLFPSLHLKDNKYYNDQFLSIAKKMIQFIDLSIKFLIDIFGGDEKFLIEVLNKIILESGFYKNQNYRDDLYNHYSRAILSEILNKNFVKDSNNPAEEKWEENLGNVIGNVAGGPELKVFYTLLIKYLESGKYKKDSIRNYDL